MVQELVEVSNLRAKIMLMKKYLTLCRIALEEKILLHLVSRQHFVDGPNLYSIQDLVDINSGLLLPFLQRITQIFQEHIQNCILCKAKGFICEICNNDYYILFPFEKDVATCPRCEAAFHKRCYTKQIHEDGQECVRCVRIKAKKTLKKLVKSQQEFADQESDSSSNE